MRFENGRAWLDKAQLQDVYGIFDEQKFYSVEYLEDDREAVAEFAKKVSEFQAWAREAYLQARQGVTTLPPPPAFVTEKQVNAEEKPKTVKRNTRKSQSSGVS